MKIAPWALVGLLACDPANAPYPNPQTLAQWHANIAAGYPQSTRQHEALCKVAFLQSRTLADTTSLLLTDADCVEALP